MEKTKVLTKLDFKTLKYCNLFLMKFKRRTKLWFIITAIVSLGVAIYDIFFIKQQYMFAILGGLFIIYSSFQFFTLEKKLDNSLTRFFYNRPVNSQTVEVDEEKIILTRGADPENPINYDWSFITEICEMPQYYMLMVGKGSPIIIDRSEEMILEGTKENLDKIILDKAALKPHKKTDQDIAKIPVTYVHQEFPAPEGVEDVDSVVSDVDVVVEEDVNNNTELEQINDEKQLEEQIKKNDEE